MQPALNLAIFDVDGTLTDTNEVDSACYFNALQNEFNLEAPPKRFHHFISSTNLGIFHEIFKTRLNRLPHTGEVEAFINRLLSCLEIQAKVKPSAFRAIAGAKDLLRTLKEHAVWRVAIATGAFIESAMFKLRMAGLSVQDIPIASCEDAMRRTEIIRAAIVKAQQRYKVPSFNREVFVADAEWDVVAAKAIQMPFIGIRKDKQEQLEELGVAHVIADYADVESVLRVLSAAISPHS